MGTDMTPQTIEEWTTYILDVVPTDELIAQARVAGSPAFIRLLTQEGYDSKAFKSIHNAFALRFIREGLRVPSQMENCHVDYMALVADLSLKKSLEPPTT